MVWTFYIERVNETKSMMFFNVCGYVNIQLIKNGNDYDILSSWFDFRIACDFCQQMLFYNSLKFNGH